MKTINLEKQPASNGRNGSQSANGRRQPVLITGGAGFIGSNLALRLLAAGERVLLFDNLSRPGVDLNLRWLKGLYPETLEIQVADTRDFRAVLAAVSRASHVFHFAAQVAVTTSLKDPIFDFEVNTRGTLNLLESLRTLRNPPPLVFTSTNKVYGDLGQLAVSARGSRYLPQDPLVLVNGIAEDCQLSFCSPYGCSKGVGDQYVLDYARTFGLPTTVFRMSCIYGPRQFGNEDQGWVAHFLIRALANEPITIYGDGLQVRDLLFVDDLVNAFLLAREKGSLIRGKAFNIGGGPANAISLLELVSRIERLLGRSCKLHFEASRPGDQVYYVSDVTKFSSATGWRPNVNVDDGLDRLHGWLVESAGPVALAIKSQQKVESHSKRDLQVVSGGKSELTLETLEIGK